MTRHRQTRRDDRGMSMAEMVVTVGLMAIIGTLVATVATVVLRTYAGVGVRNDNTIQGELGLAAAGKVLRTAILPEQLEDLVCVGCGTTAILTAGPNSVMFYANIGDTKKGPSKVALRVVADPQFPGTSKLVQETEAPIPQSTTGTYTFCNRNNPSTCVLKEHVLARGLVTSAASVFTYYDYEGTAMAQSTIAANLPRVSSIDIVLKTQTRPGGTYPEQTTVTRVRLPNVEINVLSEA